MILLENNHLFQKENWAISLTSPDATAFSISAKEFRLLTHYRSLPVGLQVSLEAVLEGMSKELSAASRK